MNRALITGGAGFVGSYLASALLEQGWAVEIIDDLSTGRMENIAHLKNHHDLYHIFGSVMDRELVRESICRVDVVFHLAAAVGVQLIVERPVHTIRSNIRGTEIVLDICAEEQKALLLASTSEVYGKLGHEKFSEEDDMVLGPTSKSRWCYAASKIIDEFLAQAYARENGLSVIIVRLFNTIGPRQSGQYGMVVPRFIRQSLLGEPITVYDKGSQRRSFTYVEDVVNSMITLVENPKSYGEVFNIGHTKDISIYDLAMLVKQMTGSNSEIVFVPYDQAFEAGFEDMERRMPNLEKIHALTGYEPSKDLPEILEEIIAHERAKTIPVAM